MPFFCEKCRKEHKTLEELLAESQEPEPIDTSDELEEEH